MDIPNKFWSVANLFFFPPFKHYQPVDLTSLNYNIVLGLSFDMNKMPCDPKKPLKICDGLTMKKLISKMQMYLFYLIYTQPNNPSFLLLAENSTHCQDSYGGYVAQAPLPFKIKKAYFLSWVLYTMAPQIYMISPCGCGGITS